MRMSTRPEVHIVNADNGHVMATDCWCEPVSISWVRNKHGVDVLVVEHDDYTLMNHGDLVVLRDRSQDWITRWLDAADPPRNLPPPDPNERSM